ncbi:helix-turn-helix transcriptional regulator [Lysinibacillus mangiferihumi]|uniref:Helix-turn-helix transcriptional regulator n=1 Tax=Lysinibacillus mangiferihumi TaxID=1130819 RepID=A0A4U2YQK2_9BACI|nr:helix-turn-helix transcriptional regulator [Lysinibacillus mangiferihumi]TKI63194.1 helix-turn-helix transcriptional regulator [Lysinibacillus mangiferihumi]
METLGERLKLARQKAGLKQIQVKERTQINNKTLSGYENDVSEPDLTTLTVLADLYGVSLQWLSTGQVDNRINNKQIKKSKQDIAERIEELRYDLQNINELTFNGEPMSNSTKEALLEAMEFSVRLITKSMEQNAPENINKKE